MREREVVSVLGPNARNLVLFDALIGLPALCEMRRQRFVLGDENSSLLPALPGLKRARVEDDLPSLVKRARTAVRMAAVSASAGNSA